MRYVVCTIKQSNEHYPNHPVTINNPFESNENFYGRLPAFTAVTVMYPLVFGGYITGDYCSTIQLSVQDMA